MADYDYDYDNGQGYDPGYDQGVPQDDNGMFSNAMFGYDKAQVQAYIDDLSAQYEQMRQDDLSQIDELMQRVEMLEQSGGDYGYDNQQMEQVTWQMSQQIEELQAQLAHTRQDAERASYTLAQAGRGSANLQNALLQAQQDYQWLQQEREKDVDYIEQLHGKLDELEDLVQSDEFAQRNPLAAQQSAENIIAGANEEAERIRDSAFDEADAVIAQAEDERDSARRMVLQGSSGLSTSIRNLQDQISEVEGDVSGVMELIQYALGEISAALTRTDHSLQTVNNQIDRYPNPAPIVQNQQTAVYFGPTPAVDNSSLRRLQEPAAVAPPFRPTYSTSTSAAGQAPNVGTAASRQSGASVTETLANGLREKLG